MFSIIMINMITEDRSIILSVLSWQVISSEFALKFGGFILTILEHTHQSCLKRKEAVMSVMKLLPSDLALAQLNYSGTS